MGGDGGGEEGGVRGWLAGGGVYGYAGWDVRGRLGVYLSIYLSNTI